MGWRQLEAVIRENREAAEWEARQPPSFCPHDGATLIEGPRGVRDCPMGNYRWEP